jgi:ubiquinone biosynthesis protein COQ4
MNNQNPYKRRELSHEVRNPLRVALAFWRVTKDIRNTYEGAIVEMAFARARFTRRWARWDDVIATMSENPRSRKAFQERLRLGPIPFKELEKLPDGTLGRTLAIHMLAAGLDANLIKVPVDADDASYLLAHLYETHDIWHVVSGCGNDEIGEIAVGGFYAGQIPAPFFVFLLAIGLLNTAFSRPAQLPDRLEGFAKAYLAGRRAQALFGTDWTALWDKPLSDVRRSLGIDPKPVYPGEPVFEVMPKAREEAAVAAE